jgi:hypothetical protein
MKILMMPDALCEFLDHVIRSYAGQGIPPEQGLAVYQLHQSIQSAQTVDDTQVAKVKTGEVAGVPVATVSVEDATPPAKELRPLKDIDLYDRGPGNGIYDRPA